MKPIQRYEMVTFENWSRDNEHLDSYTEHQPSDNGDWVRYEDVRELEKQNKEMLEALKVSETEIRCQQLEADFNYNQCHGLPHPTLEQMEREEKWCDEVYMIRELIKRIEGEQE
jgi:hypothetical protein